MLTRADHYLSSNIKTNFHTASKDENPRPKWADGTPAHTYFVNHVVRQYDMSEGFPITTLRPIPWKNAIKEILWIYQDASNSLDVLHDKYNLHIWDDFESVNYPGTIGKRYGYVVHKYNLINKLIDGIKKDPYGRRHIMDLYQEVELNSSDGLYPCAFLTDWNVDGNNLDMMLVQRSGDMMAASGAGGWNEVQYAALLMMIAYTTGYQPGIFTHVIANEHIYDRHIPVAKTLIDRYKEQMALPLDGLIPKLHFNPKSNDFYSYTIDDFEMVDYNPVKPQLKFEVAV
jgi:thymidylate synthase